jgi:hypothetical protein
MARAALRMDVRALAVLAGFDKTTVVRVEAGESVRASTFERLRVALETAGVVFLPASDGVHSPGVALKWGVEPKLGLTHGSDTTCKPDSGLHSRAWDDEFEDAATSEAELSEDDRQLLEYIRTAPHLSDRGRDILKRDALKR